MNDRDKHLYLKMTVAAIAVLLVILGFSLSPIPQLSLTAL